MTRPSNPTDRRSRLVGSARAAILCLIALGLASPALAGGYLDNSAPADPEKPTWAVPAKRMPVDGDGDGTAAIEAELHNAELRVREAQQNAETADWAYTRARTRNYPRGEALLEIKDRRAEMGKEREEAEQSFIALVERARQEGVPIGMLSPYMDFAEQIASAPPPPEDVD